MIIRKDKDILSTLVRDGNISAEKAKAFASLAFVEVPKYEDDSTCEFSEFCRKEASSYLIRGDASGLKSFGFFALDQCVFLSNNNTMYGRILNDIESGHISMDWYDTDKATAWYGFCFCASFSFDSNSNHFGRINFDSFEEWMRDKYPAAFTKELFDSLCDDMIRVTGGAAIELMRWFAFNEFRDRHAVDIQELSVNNRTRTIRRKNSSSVSVTFGPSVVYMDRLPSGSNSDSQCWHKKDIKPHQRRGHFITLRDERYVKHPLYLIEKAIYRKPAWVGDRSAIVDGQIYTVRA